MNAQSPLIPAEFLALPPAKTLVLTPSDRARRAFSERWAQAALVDADRSAVMLPTFDTVSGFAARAWSEAQLFGVNRDPRTLVPSVVEQALWRRFAQELSGATSAESAVLAAGFAEAWQLEHYHRPTAESSRASVIAIGSNGELYREARQRFSNALGKRQAISACELMTALASSEWLRLATSYRHIIRTPSFIRRNAEEAFIARISSFLGEPNINWGYAHDAATQQHSELVRIRHEFMNERDERRAAIDWAHTRLSSRGEDRRASRIAIVVPDLHRERGAWERAVASANLDYNMSLGLAVSKHPWAAAGFLLVSALLNSISVETLSAALRHPRWGRSIDSLRAISHRERELLERGVSQCTLDEFCAEHVVALRSLKDRVIDARSAVRIRTERLARSQWSAVFERLINAFSERNAALDSGTFQLRAALLESIETWLQLDEWLPAVTLLEAQQELIEITDQGAFQPEGSDASLQVVGLLEAAGVPFDSMWLCGSSDRVLPERQRANPFLSTTWQQSVRAGLADAGECEARAERLLSGWQTLCPEICASLPLERGGEPQQWSPLWRRFSIESFHASEATSGARIVGDMERLDDEKAPTWLPSEHESRGTRAFEAQALCPRRGMAEGRLRLKRWPTPQNGLSPLQRGELVHAVAQRLGEALKQTENDFEHVRRSIADWISESVNTARRALTQIPAVVWTAESVRLQKVFLSLVEVEESRDSFRVVDIEKSIEGELCGLRLSMRVDRIDALQIESDSAVSGGESYAVIDFKSGNVQRSHLHDERLTLPQLPLYAYALGMDRVEAVAFAKVGDDEQGFTSLGSEASGFQPGKNVRAKPPEWASLKRQWKDQLERLATELLSGEASVAPAYGEATCRNCDFDRFCMVDHRALRAVSNDSDAVGAADAGAVD